MNMFNNAPKPALVYLHPATTHTLFLLSMYLTSKESGLLSTCVTAAHYALGVVNKKVLIKIGELVVPLAN